MVVADNAYANYDFAEIQNLAESGKHAIESAVHSTHHSSSTSEIFDLINYRTGQNKSWVYSQNEFQGALIEAFTAEDDAISPQYQLLTKRLEQLKSHLGLVDEELAMILKTSRKTLHNWQQGNTKPNKTKLLRLVDLHNLLNTWLSNGYPEISTLDIEDKQQILSKLQQDDVNADEFLYFGSDLMLANGLDVIEDLFS